MNACARAIWDEDSDVILINMVAQALGRARSFVVRPSPLKWVCKRLCWLLYLATQQPAMPSFSFAARPCAPFCTAASLVRLGRQGCWEAGAWSGWSSAGVEMTSREGEWGR